MLTGNHWAYLATLVDRKTRYTILVRLPGKQAAAVTDALRRRMKRLPESLKKSLTWDRGSNENTNGLLRQYLPKQWDFTHLSQQELDALAERLNTRPKTVLDFRTPEESVKTVLH